MIRAFHSNDSNTLWQLFFNTVRNVNRQHYSQQQVEVWAKEDIELSLWQQRMITLDPFVCLRQGIIAGYADLQDDGLIDHFYCHREFQGQGVGRELMTHIHQLAEQKGLDYLYSNVSITARPFFERFGFSVTKEQRNEREGVLLINYRMEKRV
ncbi:GCN5-like N-acetyltransferase [Vibrio sinaloensis DSM 21326]|uniref:GCN5-like N-acetyltransferase n=1 Tax=Vibrio sinaloensis DSM 21326 TaxID=945550 RepID=E8MAL5_PHOS4|nr:GNAT family N-acetyltransferase [Vibrio sinaloensis]EGA68936.1 GCN5-like N-acetyltransferase [Vibrio sinaloensis DSM 21326]